MHNPGVVARKTLTPTLSHGEREQERPRISRRETFCKGLRRERGHDRIPARRAKAQKRSGGSRLSWQLRVGQAVSAGGGGLDGLVHCIHASRTAAALALTGGGTGAIPLLLRRPGGSRTVLDVAVPYGPKAVAAYLGEAPSQACSAATAQLLARRAFRRAVELRPDASIPVVGLGATAALATDRVRRGEDRLHAATFDGARTLALEWRFQYRTRIGDLCITRAWLPGRPSPPDLVRGRLQPSPKGRGSKSGRIFEDDGR